MATFIKHLSFDSVIKPTDPSYENSNRTLVKSLSINGNVPFNSPLFNHTFKTKVKNLSFEGIVPFPYYEKGEATFEHFLFVKDDPNNPVIDLGLPKSTINDCCFQLPAYATTTGNESLKNDYLGVVTWWNNAFSSASMKLQKYVSGTWTDQATLNNSTYGDYYTYGFQVNELGESLMGYKLNWRDVLIAFGEGTYRIKSDGVIKFGGTATRLSFEYCLQEYKPEFVNGSVRIDYKHSGVKGDLNRDDNIKDYADHELVSSFRLPIAYFGLDTSTYEREYVRYQNGSQVWVKDDQVEEYTLDIYPIPSFLHRFIKTDILQSDEILITDYNADNQNTHIKRSVIPNSNHEPRWNYGTKLAGVELKFKQAIQNRVNKRN